MVASGASLEETEAILGANAVVSRFDMRRGCHVTVMESGKFLGIVSIVPYRSQNSVLVFDDQDVISTTDT